MSVVAEIDPLDPHRITVTAEFRHRDMAKSISGMRYDKSRNIWTMPLGWAGCLALRGVFQDELEIGEHLGAWAVKYRNEIVNPALTLRSAMEAPGPAFLYPHQRADVAFLTHVEQGLLGNEMGLGKSAAAICTWAELVKRGHNPFPVLIVTPNSVKNSWKREIDKFWPGLTVQVIKGSAIQRRKQLGVPAHVYVINWEALRSHSRLAPYGSVSLAMCVDCGGENEKITSGRCERHPRELNEMTFNTVVADEIHRSKDPKAKQTRALWSATGDARFRIGLTGTPIADAPDDLWPILHWLSPEEWGTYTRYFDRFLDVMYNAFGGKVISGIKPQNRDEFYAGFDPRFRRMTKEVVLPWLPPIIRERRDVEMSPKQDKAYKQMADKMIADLDDGLLVAADQLTQTQRLLQLASSYGHTEEIPAPTPEDPTHIRTRLVLEDPSSKVDAFMHDIPDFGSDSVAVFAVSRQLIELLSAAMTKAKIPHGLITGAISEDERTRHENAFQAGKTQFILCTIGAGGTGITLTKARIAAFLQRSWSLIEQQQAMARCHRIGSEEHDSILIIDYLTPGTVEEAVVATLDDKSGRFEEIVRDRDLLRKVLAGESV